MRSADKKGNGRTPAGHLSDGMSFSAHTQVTFPLDRIGENRSWGVWMVTRVRWADRSDKTRGKGDLEKGRSGSEEGNDGNEVVSGRPLEFPEPTIH
jgi:hypothetical protein